MKQNSSKPAQDLDIPLRIVVQAPPPGVWFCIQGGIGELLLRQRSSGADLVFDVELRFGPSSAKSAPKDASQRAPWIAKGALAQGPPSARFLYVCSGVRAGDHGSPCNRRAKVPLSGLTRELVENASAGRRLTATIAGRARDGGPACASVPLLGAGWRWAK